MIVERGEAVSALRSIREGEMQEISPAAFACSIVMLSIDFFLSGCFTIRRVPVSCRYR
jgi:hypothetical protein